MKKHLHSEEKGNIKFNLYKTDETYWTIHGELKTDKQIILIEFIVRKETTSHTYNINPSNLTEFADYNNYDKNPHSGYCIACGESDTNLICHKEHSTHFHKECHQQLLDQLQNFIDNNTTLLTKTNI